MHDAGVLAELCALAGLIRLDVDSSAWVQPAQLEWLTLPRQEQWLWLVNAWLASERAPSLVGQPVNGQAAGPAVHRGAAGSTINALSAEAQRPDAPVVRKRILEILAELTQEAAAPDGQAPVLDAAAVLERADWTQPRMARRFSSLIRGVLAEAEMLGLVGSGALSQIGAAIAAEQPDEALGILGEHLPAALNHVLLQADLTAVAPGYLAPELTDRLLTMADGRRARDPRRSTVSPSPRSGGRSTRARTPQAMLEFLGLHSATAIPQPLKYLIEDTAARHARLRVGAAASFIQSDDETALLELLNAPARLRPRAGPDRAHRAGLARRAAGHGPGAPRPGPAPGGRGIRGRRHPAPPQHRAARQRPAGLHAHRARLLRKPTSTPSWPCCAATGPGAGAAGSHPAAPAPAARRQPSWGWRPCKRRSGLKQRVVMNVVDSLGNAVRETVVPVAVNGGRVRVFDPEKETERVLSIHRIIDVEAAEELLQ